jgi:hypothetical protein
MRRDPCVAPAPRRCAPLSLYPAQLLIRPAMSRMAWVLELRTATAHACRRGQQACCAVQPLCGVARGADTALIRLGSFPYEWRPRTREHLIVSFRYAFVTSHVHARAGAPFLGLTLKNGWPVSASAGAMTRLFLRSAALISPRARGEWPKTNTRVTSRKLNRRGCDQHQCQRGFPILCGRKRHKINIRRIYNAVSKRRSLSDTKKTFTSPKKITTSQPVV